MKPEVIKPFLTRLGFFTEQTSDDWGALEFSFEGINLLFLPDDDEKCVMMAVPNIFGVDDENRTLVSDTANELNNTMKFLKASILSGESVWLTYEHYLGNNELSEEIVEHMIKLLGAGFMKFHSLLNTDDLPADEETDNTSENIEEEEETEDE